MKDLFKSFYKLDDSEFKVLWENAIFIFDTNILLNLYRYQSSTRDGLLDVLDKISDRIWIPYHVSLEYHRNRLTVIADQHKRFSEVRSVVSNSISDMEKGLNSLQLKKRHSHISSDKLLESMENIKNEFFSELDSLEQQSINLSSDDPILNKLNSLFFEKVGEPFSSQEDLDTLFKEGENRYSKKIAPGYLDSDKDKDKKKPDDFTYGGL